MDEQTSFVLLHVGTNNLQRSVWNIDKHSYLNLYISIADRFCAAKIIFSAILPRWESDNLFEQSVYVTLHHKTNKKSHSQVLCYG